MPRLTSPRSLLHAALQLDAVASGTLGLAFAAAAAPLAPLLGLPEGLLRGAGLALLPFAAGVAVAGTRAAVPRGAAAAVVAVNALWVAASAALVVRPALADAAPTGLGYAVTIAQALAVLAFAELQWLGLRRTARRAAAVPAGVGRVGS